MSDKNYVQNVEQPVRNLSEAMVSHLWSVSPWLRFAGIVVYICSILAMSFGLLVAVAASFVASDPFYAVFPVEVAGGAGVFLGLLCAGIGVVLFFPARYIYGFGSRIRDYILSNSEQALEMALESNKSLWKFLGVTLITLIALVPAGVVFTIFVKITGLF
ncbi:hypothetical protein AGMMS49991_02130 [Spirochaetia bacterium]|nr:hypothetical protein AGMMS49991_02130 [Spirochaetia bacterium]